ncbi:MAG: hypothetical protein M3O31_02890 [Acidobacteriota bacterium]|nr:hypothetical protein [Acidobacteriota bacterium]
MVHLGLAVLMMLSAWAAWRRNPMFSARSTVRVLLSIGLAIGGSIALIVATIHLTAHSPMAVVGSAIAAVVIVDSLALIFILQAVSVPRNRSQRRCLTEFRWS